MPAAHFTSLGNSKLDSSYTHKIINWPQFIKMVPWSSKTIYLANNKVQKTSLYSTKFSFDHYGTGKKNTFWWKKSDRNLFKVNLVCLDSRSLACLYKKYNQFLIFLKTFQKFVCFVTLRNEEESFFFISSLVKKVKWPTVKSSDDVLGTRNRIGHFKILLSIFDDLIFQNSKSLPSKYDTNLEKNFGFQVPNPSL